MGIRVSKYDLPKGFTPCPYYTCVYSDGGYCDNPRNNKGNSDAVCHKINNKDLLKLLNDYGEAVK